MRFGLIYAYVFVKHSIKNEIRVYYVCIFFQTCICARLCQSLVLGAYTYMLNPENKYVLCTASLGWQLLAEIWNEPEKMLIMRWKKVMQEHTLADNTE